MRHGHRHLRDEELLQWADGELASHAARQVESHLAECWACRGRARAMEDAIVEFIGAHRGILDSQLPPPAGPRALLKAQLAAADSRETRTLPWMRLTACAALMVATLGVILMLNRSRAPRSMPETWALSAPQPKLTPGAVLLLSKDDLCSAEHANNRPVPVSIRRKVFEAYGIANADMRGYEVDYLITPALGGSDDIRNLWPQPYTSTIWNAHVKDALEEHLRGMVCEGRLDLTSAQRELSQDWITAYKKYFHTDRPRAIDQ